LILGPGVDVIGIDIVDVSRIEAVATKHGERFLRRVFTEGEINYARGKRRCAESLAGRFAAKEAFMKACGRRLPWRDIEVVSAGGAPSISFQGKRFTDVSISHERAYAVAVVSI
jgi:holo-[acyl-carrier protein] synthase